MGGCQHRGGGGREEGEGGRDPDHTHLIMQPSGMHSTSDILLCGGGSTEDDVVRRSDDG